MITDTELKVKAISISPTKAIGWWPYIWHKYLAQKGKNMDIDRVKRISEDGKFISGIYNYCDRWCERCTLTSHCANYALAGEEFADLKSHDLSNKQFWEQLLGILKSTLVKLEDIAGKAGIDSDIDEQSPELAQIEDAGKHPICKLAMAYGQMADQWLDDNQQLFQQKQDEWNLTLRLGIANDQPRQEAKLVIDAVEVIRWYQSQIYTKLMRALQNLALEDTIDCDDVNGSAKVGLIGIDRSIAAWIVLRKFLADDNILDILLNLDRLRKTIERLLPEARGFIRAGFD